MAIERTFVQEVSTRRRNRFPRAWRLSGWRFRRRCLQRRRGTTPPHPRNTHGAADKVRHRHFAVAWKKSPRFRNLLYVNKNQAIILDAVTICSCSTARITNAKVVCPDLALLWIEVDVICAITLAMRRGETVFAQLPCQRVLDEEPGSRIVDPVRPTPPLGTKFR